MKLLIDNVYTKIQYEEGKQFEKYFDDILHSNIDPLDPNRYMKSAYRKHYWDGRITVYNVQNKVFPTGLVGDVIELIKQTQKSYPLVRMDIQDVRGLPIGAKNIPDTITLKDTPKGDLILDPNDPIRGYQYDAVKFCIEEQRGFVGAATGSGKATYDETLIPMADGSQKKVKDINIGDFLIGQNGKPTKVLAKYPQPIKELYKVSLLDGRKFIVCDEHLMPVYTRNQRTAKTIDNLKVKSLKSIMDDYKQVYIGKFGSKHNQYKYSIPQTDSVTYTEVKHVISPYTLGVLLAEGSLNDINKIKNITISTNEQDILNKFMKDSGLTKYTHTGKNYGYKFSQKNNDKVLPICNEILRLNLVHTTKGKFIPTEYLIDSIDNRLALLRGLIDTDGYISSSKDRTNYNVSFSTSSEKMLSTFLSLIDSLGFGRTVHIDTHKETGTNYGINIFTPMKIWSSKKHEQQAHGLVYKSNKDRYMPIVNIESVGYKPSTCFTVDNKDKLFLINDYVVTHNTIIAEALIQLDLKSINKNDKILFIVHNKIIAYQTKKRFEESLHIPIGFWGDGQKDIQQVTVCLVGTIASGLKKPEDSVKLTSNKDKVLKAMVTKYIPKLESYPNIKVVVKNFIKNNQPQYAYEEPVWEAFSDMVQPNMKDKDILKIFDSYKKQYDKLLKKKASKVYDKYHSTKDILDSVRVVVIDEAHHSSSNQYQTVMNSLPNARQRIGLSGSISQSDDVKWTALKSVISDKIFKISNKQMIDSGVSAKPYIQFIPIDEPKNLDEQVKDNLPANLDENNQALLVYQEAYRQGIIENDYRNMIIVQLLKKLYETDKTALVVVSSIEHGETLQSMLKTMKIPSAFLRGDVPMSDRQEIIDNIKAGKSKIVFGTSVVNEGMDIPSLKYLVYASAGKASTPVLQRVGRVLRKSSDKDTALIFDFSDNMSKVLYKQSMERKMIYTKEGFQLISK